MTHFEFDLYIIDVRKIPLLDIKILIRLSGSTSKNKKRKSNDLKAVALYG